MAVNKTSAKQSFGKYDIIASVSVLVIILSLFYIGFDFTGKVITTDTAVVNVTIVANTAINFTTEYLFLGAGSVDTGKPNATFDSDGTHTDSSDWSGTPANLTLENIGNTNVSLTLSVGKTAAEYIGGTSPAYQFKFGDSEAGSCATNSSPTGTWLATTKTSNTSLCSLFLSDNSADTINIGVRVVIPQDAVAGTRTDTFTATATTA